MKRLFSNLTFQVIAAILLGVLVGLYFPAFAPVAQRISKMFISLISMLIAPIIFFTIVLGIAGMSDMKKVGRVGGKALLYFEIVTTFALIIGVAVANLVKPGAGLAPSHGADVGKVAQYQQQAGEMNWGDFFTHIIPSNFVEAFAKGDILQVLLIAILFGFGLSRMGSVGQSLTQSLDKLAKVFFNIMYIVMRAAPIGAFGGMAYTISTHGLQTLKPLAMLMASVYLTMALFIFVVLNLICYLFKFSLWKYLKFIRQELLIVLGTSSSEPALPLMMDKMERLGCARSVVGLVIPTGYSFNLDGTTIYLSMATIFLAQVFHVPLSLGQQLTIIGILMVTSKGAAGVTGSGFIVLTSTLAAIKVIPVEGVALLLGVDRFMSEARAITNVIGNGIAAIVIAISEKEFDREKYKLAISGAASEIGEQTHH
ncbi:dicarboxylate/amino acid:cation symporter [Mucilaginibacter lacusdianchii]|uniref:dicarboxylate/amino acid:cation symporter n=1 Tax=Mucilaginibacter lacusdianchii TaxID=2684211 RepID=UPI00131C0041|nr:dicarboxylate/amino acid:cation symporter [Mucilaginibacter sp. JXJ CY 39]